MVYFDQISGHEGPKIENRGEKGGGTLFPIYFIWGTMSETPAGGGGAR